MILGPDRFLTGTYLFLNFDFFLRYYRTVLKKEIYNIKVEKTSYTYYLTEMDYFLVLMSVIYYEKCHIQKYEHTVQITS